MKHNEHETLKNFMALFNWEKRLSMNVVWLGTTIALIEGRCKRWT
jgi:hypothetical protein